MQWIAPSEKDAATATLEKSLWDAADQFRANSGLKAQEYSGPILGLIFLRFAEVRFAAQRQQSSKRPAPPPAAAAGSTSPPPTTPKASSTWPPRRASTTCCTLPEAADIGAKVNAAMRRHREAQPAARRACCPRPTSSSPAPCSRSCSRRSPRSPPAVDFDAFGRIYEYFLGEFARTEGQKGGEFYTPSAHRPPAGRGHRALPRPHPRPRLRLGRHVRPVGALRRRAPEEPRRRARHLRRREDRRDRPPVPPEPRRPRPGRRHPPRRQRQQLLRRPAQRHRPVRLRPRQSALQRQRRGQGAAQGRWSARAAASPSACRAPTTPTTSGFSSSTRRSTPTAAPASSWPTPPPTPAPPSRSCASSSSQAEAVDVMVAVGPNMFYTVTLPCTLWFLDKGQGEDAARRHRPLHRRPPHLPADRPRPPRLDRRADRLHRQPRPPLSRRSPRLHPRRRGSRAPSSRRSSVPQPLGEWPG